MNINTSGHAIDIHKNSDLGKLFEYHDNETRDLFNYQVIDNTIIFDQSEMEFSDNLLHIVLNGKNIKMLENSIFMFENL